MAKTYYTIQGDMWDGIAKKLYDDESGVNALLETNQQYADIVVFPASMSIAKALPCLPMLSANHRLLPIDYRYS